MSEISVGGNVHGDILTDKAKKAGRDIYEAFNGQLENAIIRKDNVDKELVRQLIEEIRSEAAAAEPDEDRMAKAVNLLRKVAPDILSILAQTAIKMASTPGVELLKTMLA